MKNGKGQILESNLAGKPVIYLHGADNMPVFTAKLSKLKPGDLAFLTLLKSENDEQGLDDDFFFDVIIDDVRKATQEEIKLNRPLPPNNSSKIFCDPGCIC